MDDRDPRVDPIPGDEVSEANGGRHFTVLDRYVDTSARPSRDPRSLYAYQRGPNDGRYFSAMDLEFWHRVVTEGTVWRRSAVRPESWDEVPRWSGIDIIQPCADASGTLQPYRKKRLLRWLRSKHWLVRRIAAEEATRMNPAPALVPALRKALLDEDDVVARDAAAALKRLGAAAAPAVQALFWAAGNFRESGRPQRFCACVDALAWIVPDHPRLVELCRRGLQVPDYGIQEAAIRALAVIRRPEARAILCDLDAYRDTSVTGEPFELLRRKITGELIEC